MNKKDKALKDILQGREVEKKIQVFGPGDKEFKEKMAKEKEEERKASESFSKTMSEVRMPLFCPECNNIMTKRLDKKFWYRKSKCFNCCIEEETQMRKAGTWGDYVRETKKANAKSWLRDQEQGFKEWKEMALNPKDIVNEDGSIEKWSGNIEESKKFVKKMEKEFKEMKKQILKTFEE